MSWRVYLLRCEGGTLYTGMTNDLDRRLAAHARGVASRYTRARLPVTLVYQETCGSLSAALKREAAIKKLRRDEKLKLIEPPAGSARPG
jgi:putative endonuclease